MEALVAVGALVWQLAAGPVLLGKVGSQAGPVGGLEPEIMRQSECGIYL